VNMVRSFLSKTERLRGETAFHYEQAKPNFARTLFKVTVAKY
jgi:hypothetical protein